MIKRCLALITLVVMTLSFEPAQAKIVDMSGGGFTIKHTVDVNKSPAEAYRLFAGRISAWWDPEHTYSGKSENLSIDVRPNGCFCERLDDQGNVVHMTVIYAQPGKVLRMTGALGPLQQFATAGVLTIEFSGDAQHSVVNLTYAVGGYIPGGFEKLAPAVDQVMVGQLTRFEQFVKTVKP